MNIIPGFLRDRLSHRPQLAKIIDNISWSLLDNFLRLSFGFLISILIARQLGPQHFGELNYALSYIGIFYVFAGLGLENIVIRDLVRTPAEENKIVATTAWLLAASSMTFFAFSIFTVELFELGDHATRYLIMISAIPLLTRPFDIANLVLSAKLQTKYIAWIRSVSFFLFAGIKIILFITGLSVEAIAWTLCFELILTSAGTFLIYLYVGNRVEIFSVSRTVAVTLFRQGLPMLLSGLSIMIYWRIDQVMLGEMVGHDQVGIYSMAVKIGEIWYFIPSIIIATLAPAIINAKKSDPNLYTARLQGLCALIIWFSIGFSLIITMSAPFVIPVILGETYAGVTPILLVLIWIGVFAFLGGISMQWYLNENMEKAFLYRTTCGAIINVLLNVGFIPLYGGLGAAYATAVSYIFVGLLLDYFSPRTRPFFWLKLKAFNPFRSVSMIRKALAA